MLNVLNLYLNLKTYNITYLNILSDGPLVQELSFGDIRDQVLQYNTFCDFRQFSKLSVIHTQILLRGETKKR